MATRTLINPAAALARMPDHLDVDEAKRALCERVAARAIFAQANQTRVGEGAMISGKRIDPEYANLLATEASVWNRGTMILTAHDLSLIGIMFDQTDVDLLANELAVPKASMMIGGGKGSGHHGAVITAAVIDLLRASDSTLTATKVENLASDLRRLYGKSGGGVPTERNAKSIASNILRGVREARESGFPTLIR